MIMIKTLFIFGVIPSLISFFILFFLKKVRFNLIFMFSYITMIIFIIIYYYYGILTKNIDINWVWLLPYILGKPFNIFSKSYSHIIKNFGIPFNCLLECLPGVLQYYLLGFLMDKIIKKFELYLTSRNKKILSLVLAITTIVFIYYINIKIGF